jgi:hypothetical protein
MKTTGGGLITLIINFLVWFAKSSLLEQFIRLKTNFPQHGCRWYYEGTVKNPLNGKVIAGIVGVESINIPKDGNSGKMGTPHTFSYSSNKLFCYVDPKNLSNPLLSFRSNPVSPVRKVSPIRLYEPSVTIITSKNESCILNENQAQTEVAFSRVRKAESLKLSLFQEEKSPKALTVSHIIKSETSNRKTSVRRPWFGIGASKPSSISHENYKFSQAKLSFFKPPSVTVEYQRFGEGPSWYMPGKPVLIELTGYRIGLGEPFPKTILRSISQFNSSLPKIFTPDIGNCASPTSAMIGIGNWYRNLPLFRGKSHKK